MITDFDGVMRRHEVQEEDDDLSITTPTTTAAAAPEASFDAEIEIEKMIRFFDTIDDSNFDKNKKEALLIINDRMKNDIAGQTIPFPTDLFVSNSREKAKIRAEITDLLQLFIPECERKRNSGTAYLKSWFEENNLNRYFMYRSKESLVTFGVRHFNTRLSTNSSYSDLVKALIRAAKESGQNNIQGNSDIQQDEDAGQQSQVEARPVINEVIKAVMKRSFMKHLKGEAREHCQMGHKLELSIGRDFMRDLNEKINSEVSELFHFTKLD